MSSCVYLVLSLAYELPEDGTDVPKHVGAGKDCMDVFVVSAFVCFFFFFLLMESLLVISQQDEQLRAQYHYLLTTPSVWLH